MTTPATRLLTIAFNTGNPYQYYGQIIFATLYSDGVVTFNDHSRMIDGECQNKANTTAHPDMLPEFLRVRVTNDYVNGTAYHATDRSRFDNRWGGANASSGLSDANFNAMKGVRGAMQTIYLAPPYLPKEALLGLTIQQLQHQYITFCTHHRLSYEGSADDLFHIVTVKPHDQRSDLERAIVSWVINFRDAYDAADDADTTAHLLISPPEADDEDDEPQDFEDDQDNQDDEGSYQRLLAREGVECICDYCKRHFIGMPSHGVCDTCADVMERGGDVEARRVYAADDEESEPDRYSVMGVKGDQTTELYEDNTQRACRAFVEGYTRRGDFGGWASLTIIDASGEIYGQYDAPEVDEPADLDDALDDLPDDEPPEGWDWVEGGAHDDAPEVDEPEDEPEDTQGWGTVEGGTYHEDALDTDISDHPFSGRVSAGDY